MSIEERINRWIEAYDRNGYLNGVILVGYDDRILLNRGFGMANMEHEVSNKPDTKFRIGSLTKAFTAMAVFQLHEAGRLNIHAPVGNYLPDYPNGERITVYHCLTNTSGIPNYAGFTDFWSRTMRLPSTLDRLMDTFKNRDLQFEPGSRFEYSNSGYALLTAIVEEVSGLPYGEYIRERICRPLGMNHTGCDDGVRVVPGLASGYSYWERPIHAAYADMSFPLGAYGMYSTAEDLFLWDQALRSSALLSKELTEIMFTPYRQSYACGWTVNPVLGRCCWNHFGDISGFFCDFLRFADEPATILFLSNMNVTPASHLSRELAGAVLGEETALPLPCIPVPFPHPDAIEGHYGPIAGPTVLEITVQDQAPYMTVSKMYGVPYKFKLIPVEHSSATTILLTEMIHEQLTFHYTASGSIRKLEYTDCNGATRMLFRMDETKRS